MSESRVSALNEARVKSKKAGDSGKQKFKQKRLVVLIYKLAPKIISYVRLFCHKLKKKNSHQIMLFPDSVNNQP